MANYYSAGMPLPLRVPWVRVVQAILVLGIAAMLAMGFSTDARADAAFEGSTPANGETVPGPLTEIELRFSDPIGLNETETRLIDAEGTDLIYEPVELDDGNAWLLEPAISLDEGIYGVVWQAEAADGHTVRGVIRFGVGDVILECRDHHRMGSRAVCWLCESSPNDLGRGVPHPDNSTCGDRCGDRCRS